MGGFEQNPVLKSVYRAADSPKHVKIDKDRIREFARSFRTDMLKPWGYASPTALPEKFGERLAFLFVFNSISFSYWGEPKWRSHPPYEELDRGTWNMIAALQRARLQGIDVLGPASLENMSEEILGRILQGNVPIPLLAERCRILREVGACVNKRFDGDFSNVVKSADGDAIRLLGAIVTSFPSFEDSSTLEGERVYFYKRAQLLVSDIDQQFFGSLDRVDELTACADYVIPMVLRHAGVLEYSRELSEMVDTGIDIQRDSLEEIEIRASTIIAVEMIKEELNRKCPGITSMEINDYLWLAKNEVPKGTKYHLTRTNAY